MLFVGGGRMPSKRSTSLGSLKVKPPKAKLFFPKQSDLRKLILASDLPGLENVFREHLLKINYLFEDRRKKDEGIYIVDQRKFKNADRQPENVRADQLVDSLAEALARFFLREINKVNKPHKELEEVMEAVKKLASKSHIFESQTNKQLLKFVKSIKVKKKHKDIEEPFYQDLMVSLVNVFKVSLLYRIKPKDNLSERGIIFSVALIFNYFGFDKRPTEKIYNSMRMEYSRKKLKENSLFKGWEIRDAIKDILNNNLPLPPVV
jgi:hypothetical protein